MYRRLVILSAIIFAALAGLVWLGYRSLDMQAQGMAGARLGEFAAVAEQIRKDVKRNLDEFMQTEQNRPYYTDYQPYYVPESVLPNQQQSRLPSPLGGRLDNGLAYGSFQIEPDGSIITPNDDLKQSQEILSTGDDLQARVFSNTQNIENNVWPALSGRMPGSFKIGFYNHNPAGLRTPEQVDPTDGANPESKSSKSDSSQKKLGQNYPIGSLQNQSQQAQVVEQRRSVLEQNTVFNVDSESQQTIQPQRQTGPYGRQSGSARGQAEIVQVRIEPFVPLVIPDEDPTQSIFGGQVFLLRHVQIENRRFMQGFQLNERKLIEEGKAAEYYRNMRQESERLSRLIENVLDFSRIQRGRKKYAFHAGDMNKCVADVVEMMEPYAAQKGFSIKAEFGPLEESVFDSDAVTQIVVNLLDNAVKYARNAEDKTIVVRTATDSRFTLVEVEDHGPGIPALQRKKIFEQFYRSGAEATRETTGIGLGLALVKKFAEAHGGFVEIANAKPTGAIFRVALAAPT